MATAAESPARSIDFPLEQLPAIDEHGTLIHAPIERAWDALLEVMGGTVSRISARGARVLGCVETERSGDVGTIGSTLPGFMVAGVVEPAVLALEGEHRFSRYGLIFRLEPTKDGKTLLRAETRALFPGIKGRIYRALVIGTRGHVLGVNRLLRGIRRRAERG